MNSSENFLFSHWPWVKPHIGAPNAREILHQFQMCFWNRIQSNKPINKFIKLLSQKVFFFFFFRNENFHVSFLFTRFFSICFNKLGELTKLINSSARLTQNSTKEPFRLIVSIELNHHPTEDFPIIIATVRVVHSRRERFCIWKMCDSESEENFTMKSIRRCTRNGAEAEKYIDVLALTHEREWLLCIEKITSLRIVNRFISHFPVSNPWKFLPERGSRRIGNMWLGDEGAYSFQWFVLIFLLFLFRIAFIQEGVYKILFEHWKPLLLSTYLCLMFFFSFARCFCYETIFIEDF